MQSVFQKFGGIRPMAARLCVPPSTVKSWHSKLEIPRWRHRSIMEAAAQYKIQLEEAELTHVLPGEPEQAAA